jgi:hypothetical protein
MFSPQNALIESEIRASLDRSRGFLLIAALWTWAGFIVPLCFTHHLHLELSRETGLTVWSVIAGVGTIANWISVRRMYFAVMPGQLQVGRSPHETIIEFSEIESLVVGLPPDQSRMARIARFDHMTSGARKVVEQMRRDAVFIRLRSGHYLALYISTFWFANADALKSTLLQRNREKVIGADSYTPEEVKSLARVYFNKVK